MCWEAQAWAEVPVAGTAVRGLRARRSQKPTVRQFLTIVSGYLAQLQEVNEK